MAEEDSEFLVAFVGITILSTFIGFLSKLRLSYWGLLFHACYSISVVGGFYAYIVISYFIDKSRSDDPSSGGSGSSRIDEPEILLLTSFPLLLLFGMGIYSCVLLIRIDNELDERKKASRNQPQRFHVQERIQESLSDLED